VDRHVLGHPEPPIWHWLLSSRVRPEGPTDDNVDALVVTDGDRQAVATLMAPGWRPSNGQITQAHRVCFTEDGGVVLAVLPPKRWNLPGGTIEPGESPEDALVRQFAEEAGATVIAYRNIASQHIWDPENPGGLRSYYQSRWWARVILDAWNPRHETVDRIVVRPEAFLDTLFRREKTIAQRPFSLALDIDRDYRLQYRARRKAGCSTIR
jgi:8-oxo-dGTP pyrophosphatase MutT (NUDIX family)